jgi:flavin reductase (DIM6/NTAB) family NADH-FMN oxidoreductase RutF
MTVRRKPLAVLCRASLQEKEPPRESLMFYDTRKNDHGLPHNPFKAIVVPRPIGWITSMSAKGDINLAPYSFFNAITDRPPIVMFSSERPKDSLAFVEETKEFVCSLATFELRDHMNGTSAALPRGESEMKALGLEPAPSRLVRPPRVAASPCALECRWIKTVRFDDVDAEGYTLNPTVVFGLVVGVYIDDRFIKNGRLDTAAMRPIARCGYDEYATVDSLFTMPYPARSG